MYNPASSAILEATRIFQSISSYPAPSPTWCCDISHLTSLHHLLITRRNLSTPTLDSHPNDLSGNPALSYPDSTGPRTAHDYELISTSPSFIAHTAMTFCSLGYTALPWDCLPTYSPEVRKSEN